VGNKGNKQWVWLALDVATHEIVGCSSGDRSSDSALALGHSMLGVYRQGAVVYTDYGEAYATVLPRQRHCAVGKETGLTSDIERFNNTLRQRVSRFGQKDLIVFQDPGKPHWGNLEFHSLLQRTDSVGVVKLLKYSDFSLSFNK
jgi:IS1 family transposase